MRRKRFNLTVPWGCDISIPYRSENRQPATNIMTSQIDTFIIRNNNLLSLAMCGLLGPICFANTFPTCNFIWLASQTHSVVDAHHKVVSQKSTRCSKLEVEQFLMLLLGYQQVWSLGKHILEAKDLQPRLLLSDRSWTDQRRKQASVHRWQPSSSSLISV